jgi:hypothetical protein
MTYNQSLGGMLTLAHESGHAYHGAMMRDIRPYGRGYPMTLAETASTFGEQVLMNGILDDPAISAAKGFDPGYRNRTRSDLPFGHSGPL